MPKDAQKPTFSTSDDILTYLPSGAVRIDLENILTIEKIIVPNMLLLKQEGIHFDVVQVLDIWDEDGFVYLRIQDRKTGRIGNISHILDRSVKYFVWSLISMEYIEQVMVDWEMKRAIVGS